MVSGEGIGVGRRDGTLDGIVGRDVGEVLGCDEGKYLVGDRDGERVGDTVGASTRRLRSEEKIKEKGNRDR